MNNPEYNSQYEMDFSIDSEALRRLHIKKQSSGLLEWLKEQEDKAFKDSAMVWSRWGHRQINRFL